MSVIEKVENYRGYVLTVDETADMLIVSDSSVYRDIYSSQLNAVKIGYKRYIITKTDLLAYLKDMQNGNDAHRENAMEQDIFMKVFGCRCYKGFWVNNNIVAGDLKISKTHLRNLIMTGKVKAEYIRANRRISMESMREYLDKNQTFNLLLTETSLKTV